MAKDNGNPPLSPLFDGRDQKGRFTVGNPGGPGRPLGCSARWRQELGRATGDDQIKALVEAMFKKAIEGDTEMMLFLSRALFGDNWAKFVSEGEDDGTDETTVTRRPTLEAIQEFERHFGPQILQPSVPGLAPLEIKGERRTIHRPSPARR